mmetsp:Transcript_8204/g.24143  ORF Transcript_8204/g.24143 Transcript_8204/m.24143 type:complete len:331 (-) Transcript_8204:458-1450(-)
MTMYRANFMLLDSSCARAFTFLPSLVLARKFITVRNCANSTNSSRAIKPLFVTSKSAINCLHLSVSMTKGCASLSVLTTSTSSFGSRKPLLSTSRDWKCWKADSWNEAPVTCSTSHSGKKGMIVQSRSLSCSMMRMKSWKEFSSTMAVLMTSLPSSDSTKPATMTNCTRAVNSSRQITPSSLLSNISQNFLTWSDPMEFCLAVLSCTMTGTRSAGVSSPLPLVSRPLNSFLQSSSSSLLSSSSRKSAGRKGSTIGRLSWAAVSVSSRVSTLLRLTVVPRVVCRTDLLSRLSTGRSPACAARSSGHGGPGPSTRAFFAADNFFSRAKRSST